MNDENTQNFFVLVAQYFYAGVQYRGAGDGGGDKVKP